VGAIPHPRDVVSLLTSGLGFFLALPPGLQGIFGILGTLFLLRARAVSPCSFCATITFVSSRARPFIAMRGGTARHVPLRRLQASAMIALPQDAVPLRSFSSIRVVARRQSHGSLARVARAHAEGGKRPGSLRGVPSRPGLFRPGTPRFFESVSNDRSSSWGPLEEYDQRVNEGILRNDEHQRGEFALRFADRLAHG